MLRKFRVKNFLSFRDWQTLDLTVAANAPDLPGRFVRSVPGSRDRFPTFVAIFGANASGKTNILRALTFVARFVQFSQNDPPNQPIPSLPFFSDNLHDNVSEFEIELDGAIGEMEQRGKFNYKLAISADQTRVVEEELRYYPFNRPRRLFSRRGQNFEFGEDFRIRNSDPSIEKIRNNSSIISTLAQFNHPLSIAIVDGLRFLQSNVVGIMGNLEFSIDMASRFYQESPTVLNEFVRLSAKFDMNIERIEVVSTDNGLTPLFYHRGVAVPIHHTFESHGTNRLFLLFPMLYFVLNNGGVAFVDEFDNAVHSLLLSEIVDMFVDPEINTNHAQLITVCQNPSILQEIEKEEVYFTEKNIEGATTIYGLKEIEGVRRESNIYAKYLAGAFGGVPRVA